MKTIIQIILISFSIIILIHFKLEHPVLVLQSILILAYILFYKADLRKLNLFVDKNVFKTRQISVKERVEYYNDLIKECIFNNDYSKILEYQNRIKELENTEKND